MATEIFPIPLGVDTCYVLKGAGVIVIDAGQPASVDRRLGDETASLEEFGIPGRVIPTPGHSPGSVSVLLDSGEVFVGDLAMNMAPLTFSPGLPIFADDLEEVVRSWKTLLELGATKVFPAHGKPFSSDVIRRILDSMGNGERTTEGGPE